MATLTASRRDTRTYVLDGRERYADTGRHVDETFGSHVVLLIVDDAPAWAAAIESEGDAEPARWPRASRYIGEQRRREAYESATRVREDGNYTRVYGVQYDSDRANAVVADLRRSHPNPGVRYEVAAVEEVDHCALTEHCRTPRIFAAGVWWHVTGGYPVDCAPPPAPPEPAPAPDNFVIDTGAGTLRCGWCQETAHWPQAALGYVRLTGFHMLGIHRETRHLVLLAEGTASSGAVVYLPHHCLCIPAERHARYAPESVLARA